MAARPGEDPGFHHCKHRQSAEPVRNWPMSNSEDLLRPHRVDPDAMFAALDRVVAETPIGIPQPALAPPVAEVIPPEPAAVLFPAPEEEPQPGVAAPPSAPRPDPAVVAAHFTPPEVVEESFEPESEPTVL